MKIGVLCNSIMAIPAVHYLHGNKLLAGVLLPDVQHDGTPEITQALAAAKISYGIAGKKDLAKTLADWIRKTEADTVLTLTFPYIIKAETLKLPKLGFFNFHFGQLPQYRGGDPVFWQIANSEPNGAITVHKMDEGLDTGPIVLQMPVPIQPGDTYGMHMQHLAQAGMYAAHELAQRLSNPFGAVPALPQDETKAKYYKRPDLSHVVINWQAQTAKQVQALVNACNPWNKGAYTVWQGQNFRAVQVSVSESSEALPEAGTIYKADAENGIQVATVDGKLVRLDVIVTHYGIYTGSHLLQWGIKPGQKLSGL